MAGALIEIEDLPSTVLPDINHIVAAMKDGATVRLTISQLRQVMLGGASNVALALKDLSNTDGPRGKLGAFATASSNYNNFLENGLWVVEPGTANAPEPTAYYVLRVEATNNPDYATQYARGFTADSSTESRLWKRDKNVTWTSWIKVRENEAEQQALWDARYQLLGNYQPLDATLTALAALVNSANKAPYFTATDVLGTFDTTTLTRAFMAAATNDAAMAAIGAAPRPQQAVGRGIWSAINAAGVAAQLPAGGSFAYLVFGYANATGVITNGAIAGVAAGGATVASAVAGWTWIGFSWNLT